MLQIGIRAWKEGFYEVARPNLCGRGCYTHSQKFVPGHYPVPIFPESSIHLLEDLIFLLYVPIQYLICFNLSLKLICSFVLLFLLL
jgi:hypothetical protein